VSAEHVLLRDGEQLAPLEIADSPRARRVGLLGRDGVDGAVLLSPAVSVHTFRMRFAIDVAFLDGSGRVLRLDTLAPNRLSRIVLRSRSVLETEAGVMRGWSLEAGDVLSWRPS
jgi:uncharacterized protein